MNNKIKKYFEVTFLCLCAGFVAGSNNLKNVKTMHLFLKQSESAKPSYLNIPRLTKRDILPGNGPYVYNGTDTFEYGRKLSEMTKESERMRDDLLREIEKERKMKEDQLYNNKNNYVISFNNHQDSTNTFPFKPVVLTLGVLLAVFVVFILIRLCGYERQSSSQRTRNNNQSNIYNPEVAVPRLNRCGHTSCSRNYLLNPAGACRFQHNILPTAPIIHDEMDIERPRTYNTRNRNTQLDLPPTYSSSAHNSTQNLKADATSGFNKNVLHPSNSDDLNLPPSYDEAIHECHC